jgi:hypothetical protein
MHTDTAVKADLETLRDLNRDYVRSVQTSDVRWFDEIRVALRRSVADRSCSLRT